MIFSSTGPKDELSEIIRNFILDSIARNNNSLENLEVSKNPRVLILILVSLD